MGNNFSVNVGNIKSVLTIQQLLGHSNIQTTTIYTHVSSVMIDKVVSPLDVGIKEAGHE